MFRNPDKKVNIHIAKVTFVKKTGTWKVFRHKSEMKWHKYDPVPEVQTIAEWLKIVNRDEHACFRG
ncbi:MAG: DUF3024 domain-containing protein [Spirochaetes bacterium]|nr:DUF3024 domain-containing protein [Spirochaetota bacterium]